MLIRVAVVGENSAMSSKLANCLIDLSIKKFSIDRDEPVNTGTISRKPRHMTDVEVDIGFYSTVELLLDAYKNLDIVFFPYAVLEKELGHLHKFYRCNSDCIAIPVGKPDGLICRYLAIRPGGHLRSYDDIEAVQNLYKLCVKEASECTQVFRFTTRQGAYAINIREIVYCQSNQKYIQIETISGTTFKKIGKLVSLADSLPDFWRIHQSYLVNPMYAIGLEKSETGWDLCLTGGLRLPVSRAYRGETEERFQKYLVNI